MNKFLFVVLMFTCQTSIADWVLYGGNEQLDQKEYYENNSLRRDGVKAKMWTMNTFSKGKEIAGKFHKSRKSYKEYDCLNERIKILSIAAYADEMGAGKVIHSHTNSDNEQWEQVIPNTIGESAWKIACEK